MLLDSLLFDTIEFVCNFASLFFCFTVLLLHCSCTGRELLRGPLYYVLMLILSALVFWRDSPVGVISLSMMCGGDGNISSYPNIVLFHASQLLISASMIKRCC